MRNKLIPSIGGILLTLTAFAEKADAAPDTGGSTDWAKYLFYLAPVFAVAALGVAYMFYQKVTAEEEGTDTMKEIAEAVREGAGAYLSAQFKSVAKVIVVLFIVFVVMAAFGLQSRLVPLAFVTGALFSALTGYLGMKTATMASARTANGCRKSLNDGLQVAFKSGAVMGLVVVGFGLLMICLWFGFLYKVVYTPGNIADGSFLIGDTSMFNGLTPLGAEWQQARLIEITNTMLGFGIGASLQALFARVGGGIYTKAADVGADLVGKVEAGIPEDDPRNPATIADNVGDNVGDVAGMGADLYESYCGSILATAALGAVLPVGASLSGRAAVTAPMIVAGIGIVLSIGGVFLVRCGTDTSMKALLHALERGVRASAAMIFIATGILAFMGVITFGLWGAIIAGLVSGMIIGIATGYYTSDEYSPTQGIAEQAKTGPATVIIDGLAVGMVSSAIPVVTIVIGILLAFFLPQIGQPEDAKFAMGLFGIGFAAVGMLSTLGITLATDAYGPIADNAGGNAEMSGLEPEVREKTDALDMLGNTTAAMGKGFAIGSAALTALALVATYVMGIQFWAKKLDVELVKLLGVDKAWLLLSDPMVICGLFLGAMLAFVFCALTMKAVGRAAFAMVEEVRRQFREMPGIMEGTQKPDHMSCVAISTDAAQKEMIIPSLLAVIIPVLTGLVLGVPGVLGLLVGGLATGFSLACLLNNAGGAWDNAKKYVEKQEKTYADDDTDKEKPLTGKGSDDHKALVTGDTVGDPFKDTSGPSLNILLKLMSMVCVIFTPLTVKLAPMVQTLLFGK